MTTRNRKPLMTLYSDVQCPFSHQTRIVVQEKQIDCQIVDLVDGHWPEEVASANPYAQGPTLFDRDIVIFHSRIIMEYLDERFPHPPLMPVYPVSRGQSRLMMHRIEQDWYSLAARIFRGEGDVEAARNELREALLSLAPVFGEMPYFMSEEFSLVDCYLAPLLWRLPALGIELNGAGSKEINAYMNRIFSRSSFKASLTDQEREIHNPL